jgi:hypothetical protein
MFQRNPEKNTLLEFKPQPVAQSLVIKIMEIKLGSSETSGSHGEDHNPGCHLGCDTLQFASILEESAASTHMTHSLKRCCTYTRLHDVMCHNTAMFVFLTAI